MKILICDIGLEREFIGIEETAVKKLAEAKTFSIPWSGSGSQKVLEDSGEIYPMVGVKGVLGDGEIRIFVILKSGYAIGISSVIGYEDLSDEIKLSENLEVYFKKAYRYDEGVVYILREESVENLPRVDISRSAPQSEEENVDRVQDREILILHVGGEKYAVRMEDISEISDSTRVNIFDLGNLYGFVKSSKNVVAVLSKWKVEPKWIVILGSIGVPCESFEILSAEAVEVDGREFVVYGDEQIDVLSEEELRRWI